VDRPLHRGLIPPIRLGVLLGECVFNIRSALDNLVCGLIRTADSLAPCKGTQFPICSSQEQWERNWQKYLKGVEPAAQKLVHGADPSWLLDDCVSQGSDPVFKPLCLHHHHLAVVGAERNSRHTLKGGEEMDPEFS
jgi:hypothetical protein